MGYEFISANRSWSSRNGNRFMLSRYSSEMAMNGADGKFSLLQLITIALITLAITIICTIFFKNFLVSYQCYLESSADMFAYLRMG